MTAPPALPDRLRAVVGRALGLDAAEVAIEGLRVLRDTVRRTTWAFDAVTPQGPRALILYVGQTGQMGASFKLQARAQQAAAALGVPVPRFLAGDDSPAALGHPFLINDMLEGSSDYREIVGRLDRADPHGGRAALLRQCASALATIHRIDASTGEPPRTRRLATCRRQLDALGPDASATFEWAFRWLTRHEPPPSPPVLIHGDYQLGNLLDDGTDLSGVLDWEWVRIGEANEDLAWFCLRAWRFGAPASLGAGGLGSIETFLAAYRDAAGTTSDAADPEIDLAGFHWWRVMAALLWGMTVLDQAQQWSSEKAKWSQEKVPSMQLAIMGRQVCEAEWDLVSLLDGEPVTDLGQPVPDGFTPSRAWKDLLG